MLNKLWPVFIIVSIIYAFFAGTINKINSGLYESVENAVNFSIVLMGTMCFWNGIMNIAYNSKIINVLNMVMNPVVDRLFPDLKNDKKIKKEIVMNCIANILGLGNAATPLGIKAMNSLQEKNIEKDKISNSMMMLIVLNTASLQLIPTTVIAIRNSLNSNNSEVVIFPIWIVSVCAIIVGIFSVKILQKIIKK